VRSPAARGFSPNKTSQFILDKPVARTIIEEIIAHTGEMQNGI
jgi:hypothetical protein